MAYKNESDKSQDVVIQALKEGKKPVVLFNNGNNDKFYEVKEFIGIVSKIIEKGGKGQISKIEVMFAENKKAQTNVFIDDTIVEGSLISLIGYFVDYGSWGLSFTAKGGSNEVLLNLRNVYLEGKLNVNKIYRTGLIFELSKVELPKEYNKSEKINKIEGLPNFYYIVEDYDILQTVDEKIKNTLNKMNGFVKNDPSVIMNVENEEDVNQYNKLEELENNLYNKNLNNSSETNNIERDTLDKVIQNSKNDLENSDSII